MRCFHSSWILRPLLAVVLIVSLVSVLFQPAPCRAEPGRAERGELVLTFGGDLSMGPNGARPRPDGVFSRGTWYPWSSLTAGLAPLVDGDLNFANLECVVSARADLVPLRKPFVFCMHPAGARHLCEAGFNLFSLANNHAFDYGTTGVVETVSNMETLAGDYPGVRFAGAGRCCDDASSVSVFTCRGWRVAFAAIGIVTDNIEGHRAAPGRPGSLNFRHKGDYERFVKAVASIRDVDLKIVSIHIGIEGRTQIDAGLREKFHDLLRRADVDVILAHHAHVPRPIELPEIKGRKRVIAYGLGNCLLLDAGNFAHLGPRYDYGIFGRLYFNRDDSTSRAVAQAMEVVPLASMHEITRPMTGETGRARIRALNSEGRRQLGRSAPVFTPRTDGTGFIRWGSSLGARALKAENLKSL